MADPNDNKPEGAPHHVHIEKKKGVNWLPWLLLALGLLALLFALSRCNRDDRETVAPVGNDTAAAATPEAGQVVATAPNAGTATALAGTSGLGTYLAGSEPAPRSFVFEKLNFDSGKSEVRAADAAEVTQVAATLKQYPTAKIRIAGYADARGSDAVNLKLGRQRAEAVKAALTGQGIEAGRIEAASGGESDPVDSNATAGGRFENRRTELAVTAR